MKDPHAEGVRRLEIRTGTLVVATDGEVGRIDGVVVSPDTEAVEGLIVRAVLQLGHDLLIPIEAVEDATEDLIRLRLSLADLGVLPPLNDGDVVAPPPSMRATWRQDGATVFVRRHSSPPVRRWGDAELRPGQVVVNAAGEVGPLDLVLLDATTGRASSLVVRRGGLAGRDTIVSIDLISEIDGDQIVLDATTEQLLKLPEYRTDDAITDTVQDLLWYRSDLPEEEVRYVTVKTVDGVVELGGYASSERGRAAIGALVRKVSGVLGVRDNVHSLETLSEATNAMQHPSGPSTGQRPAGTE